MAREEAGVVIDEIDARRWLTYAEADLRAAEHLLESGDFMASAFHCQQAVEKLLKAIIVAETGERPPYVHNLRLLLEQIETIEVPENVVRRTVEIEPHYVGARYPGIVDPEFYNRRNVERLLENTFEVYRWFLARFEEMVSSDG
jgi:HEPN domain-containing protein